MKTKKAAIFKKMAADQKGAVLILALVMLAVGVIMLIPLIDFMGSSYKSTSQVYDRQASELYASDAGVRDAIWNLKYNYAEMPQNSADTMFLSDDSIHAASLNNINDKSISYVIAFVKDFVDDTGSFKTYKVVSTAIGADGSNTSITSYVNLPLSGNIFFDYAVASGTNMSFEKDSSVKNGKLAYNGSFSAPPDFEYEPNGDGVEKDPRVVYSTLKMPSDAENQAFADLHMALATEGGTSGTMTVDGGNLGPKYITGNLNIEGSVTLTGSVYVTGDINFDKEGILNGQGVIIAEGDIKGKKDNKLTAEANTQIFFMTLKIDGVIDFRMGQEAFNAIFYAPYGTIDFRKDQLIQGSVIAGQGFSSRMNFDLIWVPYMGSDILPGTNSSPQLQTWEIGTDSGLVISPFLPSPWLANTAYDTKLMASGSAPFTWTVTTGSLPNGLNLNSTTGTISGTPTTLGPYNFTITAVDNTGKTGSQSFSILITDLIITTSSPLPASQQGNSYNQTIAATGGTSPYTWSRVSGLGSLPAGLTLSPLGTISGTPTSRGSSFFTVRVTDSTSPTAKTSTKAFSILVNSITNNIVFTTAAQGMTEGLSSGIMTIQTQDSSGNPLNVTSATTVNLTSTSGNGVFSLNATPWSTINSLTIASGSNSASFYYKDTIVGTTTLTASATGFNDGTQQETVNPVLLDHFEISTISSPKTAGTAITGITLTAKDINNNTVTSFTDTVTYSGTAGIIGTSAAFTAGELKNVSVTPTVAGSNMTFIVTGSGKTGTTTFNVNPGAVSASTSNISASPNSVMADGTMTSTITVTLLDSNNNPVSGKTVTLIQGTGGSTMSAASGASNSSGRVTFTVKNLNVQTVTYTAKDATDNITITQTANVTFTVCVQFQQAVTNDDGTSGNANDPTNAGAWSWTSGGLIFSKWSGTRSASNLGTTTVSGTGTGINTLVITTATGSSYYSSTGCTIKNTSNVKIKILSVTITEAGDKTNKVAPTRTGVLINAAQTVINPGAEAFGSLWLKATAVAPNVTYTITFTYAAVP